MFEIQFYSSNQFCKLNFFSILLSSFSLLISGSLDRTIYCLVSTSQPQYLVILVSKYWYVHICVWLCTRVCMRAQVCNNKSYRMQFKRDCQTHIYAVFFYVLNARCVVLLDFIFGRSWNTRASSKCVNFLCSSRRREIVENRTDYITD